MSSFYKIWAIGNSVGLGITGAIHVGVAGIAKRATPDHLYIVSNELLCNRVATGLLLPCPPGALVKKDDDTYFFSLDFNTSGQALPPASALKIVETTPQLAWGIILFDILVMNEDRHAQNIAHDRVTGSVRIFDHSHAFSGAKGDVKINVQARAKAISIGKHCLAAEISSPDGFDMWCSRIKAIPDFLLDGAVEEACQYGLPKEDRSLFIQTLKWRRDNIDVLVKNNLPVFPKLQGITP
jgi:hypothetical protein